MRVVCPTYSFIGAAFAASMNFACFVSWIVTILTLGWIGKDWSMRITFYSLGHKWNVVYDACDERLG